MKKENKAETFTNTVKTVGIVKSGVGIVKSVIGLIFICLISIFIIKIGVPMWFPIGLIAFMILFLILQILEYIRAKSVVTHFSSDEDGKIAVCIDSDEILRDYIAGIWRYGKGAGSYGVLGVGKNMTPENSLLITNKNIFAITVPLEGAGVVAAGTDISKWQWLNMQKEIEGLLKEMLDTMTLENLINSCVNCIQIPKHTVKNIKMSDISNGVSIVTIDKKKYSYSIREKEDYARAKIIFESMNLLT
ncbi:MAG: hypothetical protein CVU84_15905 [Firmicutes bacterium HGW-Firmicutes-1]|jgi:hypothetical protein|nr:MAG: hypothetical protein CVU84_15905 [Firmicutes bacterium HGW-Firmicutes-1]